MSTQSLYRYSHTIGMFNLFGRGFYNPVDAALSSEGILYVLSRAGSGMAEGSPKRVTTCTLDGDYLGEFSMGGTKDGMLAWPVSIAISADDNVYVSDELLNRISVFDKSGRFLGKWGTKGRGDGEFECPTGIAFDKDDNLLVVDSVNNRVQKYTKDGRSLGSWGRDGNGDGEFNLPWGIAVDHSGDVYVADWRNDRIQKFDPNGKHLASFGTSGHGDGEFYRPSGVAVGQNGNIYVADWGNERVQVLGPDSSFLDKFRGESGLSSWGVEYFSHNADELEARESSDLVPDLDLLPDDFLRNESANVEKLFWSPTSVRLDDQGNVYVVDSCRHRIQVYSR